MCSTMNPLPLGLSTLAISASDDGASGTTQRLYETTTESKESSSKGRLAASPLTRSTLPPSPFEATLSPDFCSMPLEMSRPVRCDTLSKSYSSRLSPVPIPISSVRPDALDTATDLRSSSSKAFAISPTSRPS